MCRKGRRPASVSHLLAFPTTVIISTVTGEIELTLLVSVMSGNRALTNTVRESRRANNAVRDLLTLLTLRFVSLSPRVSHAFVYRTSILYQKASSRGKRSASLT